MEADDSSLPIVQHETFGPVPILQTFDTGEQAVALANDTDYGLSACIWSRDVDSQRPLRLWLGRARHAHHPAFGDTIHMRPQLLDGYGLTGKFTLNTGPSPGPRFEAVRVRAIAVAGANR